MGLQHAVNAGFAAHLDTITSLQDVNAIVAPGTELVRRDWGWLVGAQQAPSHVESRNVADHECKPFLLSAFGLSCHVLLRVNLMSAMMDHIMSIRLIVI